MEAMIKHLSKYGGDIIKFVGDAMIIMWPETQPDQEMTTSMNVSSTNLSAFMQ